MKKLIFLLLLPIFANSQELDLFEEIPSGYSNEGVEYPTFSLKQSLENAPKAFTTTLNELNFTFQEIEVNPEVHIGIIKYSSPSRHWVSEKASLSWYGNKEITISYLDSTYQESKPLQSEGLYALISSKPKQKECSVLYTNEVTSYNNAKSTTVPCVDIYVEADYELYKSFNFDPQATVKHIKDIFVQSKVLYNREKVDIKLTEILIRDKDIYTTTFTSSRLGEFYLRTPSIKADVGVLLSTELSGGIAYLNGACASQRYNRAFCSLIKEVESFPTYSWDVMVFTHELGHLFGSDHTHACVWNGNNTAIDGCAGTVEGNCPLPNRKPEGGGTIMSYCHFTTGIDFNKGFGPQPGNKIRNFLSSRGCIENCNIEEPKDTVVTKETFVEIFLDAYPHETIITLFRDNQVVFRNTFTKKDAFSKKKVPFEPISGNYVLTISDKDGLTAICNEDPRVKITVEDVLIRNTTLKNNFTENLNIQFSVKAPNLIETIKIRDIKPFRKGEQDFGQAVSDSNFIVLTNNSWKVMPINLDLNKDDTLSFIFKSSVMGEIHAIAFGELDLDSFPIKDVIFQVYGKYDFIGPMLYKNYNGNGKEIEYNIPIPRNVKATSILFINDDDRETIKELGNSLFQNIRIKRKG